MGVSNGGISLCCHGKQGDANGFCWRFYEGPPIDWEDPAFLARQTSIEELKQVQALRIKAPKQIKPKPTSAAAAVGASAGGAAADISAEDEDVVTGGRKAVASAVASVAAAAAAAASVPVEPQEKLKLRAPSAYLHFCMEKRSEILAENPLLTVPEVGSLTGKLWKELDEAAKVPYVKLAEEGQRLLVEQRARLGVPTSTRRVKAPVGRPKKAVAEAKRAAKAAGLAAAALIDGKSVEEAMRLHVLSKRDKKSATPYAAFIAEHRDIFKVRLVT